MPITQISKIKFRTGIKQDLPQLDQSEIAVTVDTGEMWIGSPQMPIMNNEFIPTWVPNNQYYIGDYVAVYDIPGNATIYVAKSNHTSAGVFSTTNWNTETVPVSSRRNTQILTQWSRNVESLLKYSYLNRKHGFDSQKISGSPYSTENISTLVSNIWPINSFKRLNSSVYETVGIRRNLQERLDETVSVLSFGATGNGLNNKNITPTVPQQTHMDSEANAFRRAVLASTATEKSLHVPAGNYVINKKIFFTDATHLYGDGIQKTKIIFNVDGQTLDQFSNVLLDTLGKKTIGLTNSYPSASDVVDDTTLNTYMYTNISEVVTNVYIENITFEIFGTPSAGSSFSGVDIVRICRSKNIIFDNCEFIGNWSTNQFHSGIFDYRVDSQAFMVDSCSGIANAPVIECGNIRFNNCIFSRTNYISNINDSVDGVILHNCLFDSHYHGVACGRGINNPPTWASLPPLTSLKNGPRGVVVAYSRFKNIATEGFSVWRGYESDGSRSATYALYAANERLVTSQRYTQTSGNTSISNHYENVGNYQMQVLNTVSPTEMFTNSIIYFAPNTQYNMSVNDVFSRDITNIAPNTKRVIFTPQDPNIIMNTQDPFVFPGSLSAGKGLTVVGNTIEVKPSTTIGFDLSDNVVVKSNGTVGHVLTSDGLGGPAIWSAININSTSTSGSLPSNKGGTGFTTYNQGDLLYANSLGTLSRLPIGPVNTILTSTGTTASWVLPGKFVDGSAAVPSISFTNDTNTGLFRVGPDTVGISTGGVERVRWDVGNQWTYANQNVLIPTTGAAFTYSISNNSVAAMVTRGVQGQTKYFGMQNIDGSSRWTIESNASLETGANVGSNFFISRYDDAGTSLGVALNINRASGDATFGGNLRAVGDVTAYYSDERLKTNITKIENALEKVLSLNGVYYNGNDIAKSLGYDVDKREVGVLAGEILKVLPEIVVPAPVDPKYMTVKYDKLIPLLIEAIKELSKKIK